MLFLEFQELIMELDETKGLLTFLAGNGDETTHLYEKVLDVLLASPCVGSVVAGSENEKT